MAISAVIESHAKAPPSGDRSAAIVRLLRIALGALIFIHGEHRAFAGGLGLGVGLFGQWLDSQGLPFGFAIALAVTVIELVGPALLQVGRLVSIVSLPHVFILVIVIFIVHLPFGRFVVGAGRNGMEYSVLLIVGLLSLAWAHGQPAPPGPTTPEPGSSGAMNHA